MSIYLVTETVIYRVDAPNAEAVIDHVVEDRHRDAHCLAAVEDRTADLDEDQTQPAPRVGR